MKWLIIAVAILAVSITGAAFAGDEVHWEYSGHSGPKHWGELDASFKMCSEGKNQSPVDLSGFIEADLEPIVFNYETTATELLNNGHTVQANYAGGSTISIGENKFELKQFHFHAPSENRIEGKSYPMEAHLVHADTNGNLAVVAVMLEEGDRNRLIESLSRKMPEKEGDNHALGAGLDVSGMLPKDRSYHRFNGSLTTPPCSEGVWWVVLIKPVGVSKEQVEAFRARYASPQQQAGTACQRTRYS